MKKFILTSAINIFALWFIDYLFVEIQIASIESLLILGIAMTLLNGTLKPILKFLTFPITFLTLGLFSLVINMMMLELAFYFVEGAVVQNHLVAFLAAIIISVIHGFLNKK